MAARLNIRQRETVAAYLFLLPNILGYLLFTVGPVIAALALSFLDWDFITDPRFVALDNYKTLLDDPVFHQVFWNTLWFVLGTVPPEIALGILLAVAMNQKLRTIEWYRTAYFMPVVSSTVAVALIWRWLFNPDLGLINHFLWTIGVNNPPLWLGSTTWALPAVMIMSVWKGIGYNMILFLAGLQGISQHLYEAAKIDGANAWVQFRRITLPLLTPTIFFVLVLGLIRSFQVIEQALIMAEGGPANATNTIVLYIYQSAFEYFKMGYASAIAWLLFGIVFVITLVQFWGQKRWVFYD